MQTNKKTLTRMRLLAWLMAMVMMCTSISVPAFAEDISFDDEDAIELQSTDEIDVEEIADFSDGICDEEILTDEASDMDIFFSACEEENKEISENLEFEAATVDAGDEVQDEYLSSIKIGTNPSQLTEIFKGQTSEWSYTLAGRQKTIYVLATLSETAPEDSTITATYFDNSKQEQKTKTLSSTVRNNGLSNVAVQYSGKESSFTLTVGVEGNTREYKIKMPRSVEIKSPSLKASDGSALIEAEGVYLLPAEKDGSLRFKADVYNAAVTINGQSVTPESGVYTFTPQYDEKNEAEVKIAASYADNAEVKTELSYKVKHLTAEDTFSGTCGEALTWELKGDALTIHGTGAMADYEQYGTKAGWNPYISLIKSVNVEQGVTSIGNYAFYYAKTMESITFPESLVSIGDGAFCDCTNLKKIEIPLSVTNVGTLVFGWCSGLEEATLGCVVGTQMFLNCTALKKVTWKGQPTIIPASAFLGCSTLEDISIPTSVTEIGASAFGNCKSLTSLQIPIGVTKIGSSAFSSCAKLTEVTIPTGVTAIESSTFANCSTLASVTIPNGVTRIEDKAFANCTALATMTIPSSIVYVSASAFDGCSNLEGNITFEGSDSGYVTEDGLLYFKTANSKILLDGKSAEGSLTLPADVAAIDDGAFSGNTKLTEIVLQNGVKSIGKEAFKGCSALKKVTMTDSVTEIKEYAFYECTELEEVKLSNSLTEIAAYLFGKCTVLQTITIPEGVESIGSSAFWLCKGLERVTLPKSVRTWGSTCFGACSALKNLEIPNGVTELPLAMLNSCPALTTVSIPASVTKIGSNTFQYSVNLEYVLYGGSPEQWNQVEGAAMTGSSQPKVMVLYHSSHLGDQEKDAPVISEQPESAAYKKDAVAELMKVKAAALNEEGTTYFFNWQKNTEKTIKGGTSVSSVTGEDGLSS